MGGALFVTPGGIKAPPVAVGSFDVMARRGRAVCVDVQSVCSCSQLGEEEYTDRAAVTESKDEIGSSNYRFEEGSLYRCTECIKAYA